MRKLLLIAWSLCCLLTTAGATDVLRVNGEEVTGELAYLHVDRQGNAILTFADGTQATYNMNLLEIVLNVGAIPTNIETTQTASLLKIDGKVNDVLRVAGIKPGTMVCIYASSGKLVRQQKASGEEIVFSVGSLPQGVYLLRADRQVVKFVKE
jgi:hypothetical protein